MRLSRAWALPLTPQSPTFTRSWKAVLAKVIVDMGSTYGLRLVAARGFFAVSIAVLAGALSDSAVAAEGDMIVIGSGAVSGVYFPAAGAICRSANDARADDGPLCVVAPGEGSKESLEALRAGITDFAVVQSDWQFWGHKGADYFADPTPFANLNAVFALHAEPLVIAVRRDSGIDALDDLKGKRVGVGAPATAARGMMEALLGTLGWSMSDFAEAHELAASAQTAALCGNGIDAGVYAVGSPSASLAALTAECDVSLLPLTGPAVDTLLSETPYYRLAAIPAGIYAGVDTAVPTFGVGATLVTRTDVPDTIVEAIVASVFANIEAFRTMHPALTWLDPAQMARDGLAAPQHPAAAGYFVKSGGT